MHCTMFCSAKLEITYELLKVKVKIEIIFFCVRSISDNKILNNVLNIRVSILYITILFCFRDYVNERSKSS